MSSINSNSRATGSSAEPITLKSLYKSDKQIKCEISNLKQSDIVADDRLDNLEEFNIQMMNSNVNSIQRLNNLEIFDTSANLRLNNLEQSDTKLTKHLETSDNVFSIDNMNALSADIIYRIGKLNFALNAINENAQAIKDAQSYANILTPIFQNKYTTATLLKGDNVFINNIDSDYGTDRTIYQETLALKIPTIGIPGVDSTRNYIKQKRNEILKNNPSQKMFYSLYSYEFLYKTKFAYMIVMPDLLREGEWMFIGVAINFTLMFEKFADNFPPTLTSYLQKMEDAFNVFVNDSFDPNNGTIYQYGAETDFNILKIVSSKDYPYWNNQLISNSFINGSNIDMPKVISQINASLNRNYTGAKEGQIVVVDYVVGDLYYTGIVKFFSVENYGLCYQIIAINKSEIFVPSVKVTGDYELQGNFNVVDYKKTPIITTDNTRKTVCFNDKVGINQKPYEVEALLDVDNLTQQTIFDLFDTLSIQATNSYDIIQVINNLNTTQISSDDVKNLFNQGGELFDYKTQCSVLSVNIKAQIAATDLEILNGLATTALLTDRTFTKIQQITKEINNMMPEYIKANDNSFIFSFIELFPDRNQKWFFTSVRAIIRNGKAIVVLTRFDATKIMADPSYTDRLFNIIDYISRVCRNINFNTLLYKNPDFYNAGKFDAVKYEKYIQNNPYFSDKFNLFAESAIFNIRKNDSIYIYNGENREWIGQDIHDCWKNSINVGPIKDFIDEQQQKLYNNRTNSTFAIKYAWNSTKLLTFVNTISVDNIEYTIGAGINMLSLLNQSLLIRGDNKLNGNFVVNDVNENIIFNVDNVEKKITNSYKVGIGLDNPKSMLDVKDTTIQNVINEFTLRMASVNIMNIFDAKFKTATNESKLLEIISDLNNSYPSTIKSYNYLYKLNISTQDPNDITCLYHSLYNNWNGLKFSEVLDTDLLNNTLIQNTIAYLGDIINYQLIFDGAYFTKVFKHNVFGYSNVGHKIFVMNNEIYMYSLSTPISANNLNYGINQQVNLLYETRECCSQIANDFLRKNFSLDVLLNEQEGTNTLNRLVQTNKNVKKNIYKIVFNYQTIPDFTTIKVTNIDLNTYEETNTQTLDTMGPNDRTKFFNVLVSLFRKPIELNNFSRIGGIYEDTTNDNIFMGWVYNIDKSDSNNIIIAIQFITFCVQDVLTPSLNVAGDTKLIGDLLVNNENTKENFVSIDPIQGFFGINTDERAISYRDSKYTTTQNIYNSKHQVHIKGNAYPVMVSERVQENKNDIPNNVFSRFGAGAGFTVKRKSDLYDYDEMVKYAQMLNDQLVKPTDKVSHFKYGSSIGFETCDKTNRSVILGNVQMVVDSVTEEGYIRSGFGVEVVDLETTSSGSLSNSKRQLMYVDNSGTLFINKIMLGGKLLEVNDQGNVTLDKKLMFTYSIEELKAQLSL